MGGFCNHGKFVFIIGGWGSALSKKCHCGPKQLRKCCLVTHFRALNSLSVFRISVVFAAGIGLGKPSHRHPPGPEGSSLHVHGPPRTLLQPGVFGASPSPTHLDEVTTWPPWAYHKFCCDWCDPQNPQVSAVGRILHVWTLTWVRGTWMNSRERLPLSRRPRVGSFTGAWTIGHWGIQWRQPCPLSWRSCWLGWLVSFWGRRFQTGGCISPRQERCLQKCTFPAAGVALEEREIMGFMRKIICSLSQVLFQESSAAFLEELCNELRPCQHASLAAGDVSCDSSVLDRYKYNIYIYNI